MDDDRRGRGDRYMGPTTDFREKDNYRPEVKLEYVDDEGRKLNSKEAFRLLNCLYFIIIQFLSLLNNR